MKVLHLAQMIGGIEVYLRNSVGKLADDVDFVIVSGVDDNNKPLVVGDKTIKEYKINLYRELGFKDVKGLVEAIRIIRAEKPDVLHCHSAKGGMLGRIAGFLCGVPTLYTPHAFSFLSTSSSLKRRVFVAMERITKLGAYLGACSYSERELAVELVKYKSDKALVWTNSVPDLASDFKREISVGDQFNICTVGRPCYQKNIPLLVEIARGVVAKIPHAKFSLLGVGHYSPDLAQVQSLIVEYALEKNFELVDWIAQRDMFEYFKRSHLYVTTSRYEGLPLSVIEAASHGCPILATKVLGNEDCVYNAENGYLLEQKAEFFVEKIVELYNNRALLDAMSVRSREIFVEKFCLDTQIEKLKDIYKKIK